MLSYHRTSLLTSQAQTVVNTVNTVGVMGKGIASAFKKRYPDMFKEYRRLCRAEEFQVGQLWLWKAPEQWVLNFPTKKHWRNPSKLSYIQAGLRKLVEQYEKRGIREIAFPRLGCGHGGLDWDDVRSLMELHLRPIPILVYIHDFEVDIGLPEHREFDESKRFLRSFDAFLANLGDVLQAQDGRFKTVYNQSEFRAQLDGERNLLIERPGRRSIVPIDELYELWTLLLRGPVTRRKLPGAARDWAYYIFPILAHLSYVRAVEIGREDNIASMAIELIDQVITGQALSEDSLQPAQGKLEWA